MAATKKRGLGRGLDALLGAPRAQQAAAASQSGNLRELPLELVRRGKFQPRVDMHPESLQELADSIRAQGVVQPIVVRPVDAGEYEIIAGERRWRAAQMAGLQNIPAVIRDVPDRAAVAIALIENIQRENLNPLEEANALQRLISEFGATHQETAAAVGRSRAAVSNLLRLLELTDEVKDLVNNGELEMGHARALLALGGDAQIQAARQVVAKGLSVRETERFVKRVTSPPTAPAAKNIDPDIRRLEQDLAERLGATVHLETQGRGKGKLVISYNSLDELEGILEKIH